MVGEPEGAVKCTGPGIGLVVDRVAQGINEHFRDTVTSHSADDRADEATSDTKALAVLLDSQPADSSLGFVDRDDHEADDLPVSLGDKAGLIPEIRRDLAHAIGSEPFAKLRGQADDRSLVRLVHRSDVNRAH